MKEELAIEVTLPPEYVLYLKEFLKNDLNHERDVEYAKSVLYFEREIKAHPWAYDLIVGKARGGDGKDGLKDNMFDNFLEDRIRRFNDRMKNRAVYFSNRCKDKLSLDGIEVEISGGGGIESDLIEAKKKEAVLAKIDERVEKITKDAALEELKAEDRAFHRSGGRA